jgi:hypothetical protein
LTFETIDFVTVDTAALVRGIEKGVELITAPLGLGANISIFDIRPGSVIVSVRPEDPEAYEVIEKSAADLVAVATKLYREYATIEQSNTNASKTTRDTSDVAIIVLVSIVAVLAIVCLLAYLHHLRIKNTSTRVREAPGTENVLQDGLIEQLPRFLSGSSLAWSHGVLEGAGSTPEVSKLIPLITSSNEGHQVPTPNGNDVAVAVAGDRIYCSDENNDDSLLDLPDSQTMRAQRITSPNQRPSASSKSELTTTDQRGLFPDQYNGGTGNTPSLANRTTAGFGAKQQRLEDALLDESSTDFPGYFAHSLDESTIVPGIVTMSDRQSSLFSHRRASQKYQTSRRGTAATLASMHYEPDDLDFSASANSPQNIPMGVGDGGATMVRDLVEAQAAVNHLKAPRFIEAGFGETSTDNYQINVGPGRGLVGETCADIKGRMVMEEPPVDAVNADGELTYSANLPGQLEGLQNGCASQKTMRRNGTFKQSSSSLTGVLDFLGAVGKVAASPIEIDYDIRESPNQPDERARTATPTDMLIGTIRQFDSDADGIPKSGRDALVAYASALTRRSSSIDPITGEFRQKVTKRTSPQVRDALEKFGPHLLTQTRETIRRKSSPSKVGGFTGRPSRVLSSSSLTRGDSSALINAIADFEDFEDSGAVESKPLMRRRSSGNQNSSLTRGDSSNLIQAIADYSQDDVGDTSSRRPSDRFRSLKVDLVTHI